MRTLFWVKFNIHNPRDWYTQSDAHSEVWNIFTHYIQLFIQKSTKLSRPANRYICICWSMWIYRLPVLLVISCRCSNPFPAWMATLLLFHSPSDVFVGLLAWFLMIFISPCLWVPFCLMTAIIYFCKINKNKKGMHPTLIINSDITI